MLRRIFGLFLLMGLVFAPAFATQVRDNLWQAFRNINSPFLPELAAGAPRPALSSQVVCVLVRGLRLDESRTSPTLNAMRQRGLDATMTLPSPTYRVPMWVSLLSGAPPNIHGITKNDATTPLVDSLVHQLRVANKNVTIIGSVQWADWYGPDIARFEETVEPDPNLRDDAAINTAIQILNDPNAQPNFLLIELSALDVTASDNQPPTTSPQQLLETRLQRLYATMNFQATTLVVLADGGNNGGDDADVARVPLLMLGVGINPTPTQDILKQSDIAPTLAALLGAPFPIHAQSPPLINALDFSKPLPAADPSTQTQTVALPTQIMLASTQQRVLFNEAWSEAMPTPRFAAEILQKYRVGISSGNPTAFSQFNTELNNTRDAAQMTRLTSERLARAPFLIGGALALLALVGLCLQQHTWQPLLGTALFFVARFVLFAAWRGQRFSLGAFTNGIPTEFLQNIAWDSSMLLFGTCVLVALLTGAHRNVLDAALTVLSTLGVIAVVSLIPLVWLYFQWGVTYDWLLPNTSLLATGMVGLTNIAALQAQLVPNFPAVPMPLMGCVLAFVGYFVVRRKPKPRGAYERVKFR